MSSISSYQCANCKSTIFKDDDIVEVQKNHYCVAMEKVAGIDLSENGISYKCLKCNNYIGDEFNDNFLVRKDLVIKSEPPPPRTGDAAVSVHEVEEMQKQIRNLQKSVEFLKEEQNEIKKALLTMKDSFENQLVDIKRGILHLANELGKLS